MARFGCFMFFCLGMSSTADLYSFIKDFIAGGVSNRKSEITFIGSICFETN